MRTLVLSLFLPFSALAISASAQVTGALTPSPLPSGQVHCSLQPGPAAGPALNALVAGDYAQAETLYAVQAAHDASAYPGLVRAQLEQNKLPEALASARAAIAAQPSSATGQSLLGDVDLRSGLIPESVAAYGKALALDRCSARAHFGMSRLYTMTGRGPAAIAEAKTAARLSPADPEITLAYLETLTVEERLAPLRAFAAGHPQLTAERLEVLATEVATLDQHKLCTPAAEVGTAKLNLVPIYLTGRRARSWGFKSRIGEAVPILELDSSVSGIVLSASDAAKTGVYPLTTQPSDPETPYTAVAEKLVIDTVEYHGCAVQVVPDRFLANGNSVIGTDFFRDHLIRIDYVDRSVTLSPFPPRVGSPSTGIADQFTAPDEKNWSPMYIQGPNVLLPTLINKQGPFLFALDTGINRTIISPAVTASSLSGLHDGTLPIHGTSGAIVRVLPKDGGAEYSRTDVYTPAGKLLNVKTPVKLPVYRFTINEVPDPYSVSFDLTPKSHDIGVEVSGLLGFGILRTYMIEINYRDALANIQFDQNRRYLVRESEGFN